MVETAMCWCEIEKVLPRPWRGGAPCLSRPPPPLLRKLEKREGSFKNAKDLQQRLQTMGGTLASASVPPQGKHETARWYCLRSLPPSRIKCEGLGGVVFKHFIT